MNWEFINRHCIGICIVLTIVSLLFIIFGHLYRDQIQLLFKQELIRFPETTIDWWSVSHFLLFGIFGFLIPRYPLTFFTMGVTFELIEDFLSSDENTQFANCKNPCGKNIQCNKNNRKLWYRGFQDGYWYTNHTDSFVNLLGYVVGSAIRTTYFTNR